MKIPGKKTVSFKIFQSSTIVLKYQKKRMTIPQKILHLQGFIIYIPDQGQNIVLLVVAKSYGTITNIPILISIPSIINTAIILLYNIKIVCISVWIHYYSIFGTFQIFWVRQIPSKDRTFVLSFFEPREDIFL